MADFVDLVCNRKALQYLADNIGGFNPWGMHSGILRLTKSSGSISIALHDGQGGAFVAGMGTRTASEWRTFFHMDDVPHKRILEWYDFDFVLKQLG
jgi:hypothetical protein